MRVLPGEEPIPVLIVVWMLFYLTAKAEKGGFL